MYEADLAPHLFCICPSKWQTQYNLTENTTPISTRALLLVLENIKNNAQVNYKAQNPTKVKRTEVKYKMELINSCISKKSKKVGWANKHCVHCKKHWGAFKSHNRHDCHCFNKDGTPTKGHGSIGQPQKEKKPKGMSFAQIMCAELKRTLHKHLCKYKKCRINNSDSDSNSNKSS